MEAFEWLVNLLVLMSALSIVSERLANAMKLGHPRSSARFRVRQRPTISTFPRTSAALLVLPADWPHDYITNRARP